MITLYTFGPAFGLPDPSPFVVKAEMLLKLSGLEYRTDTKGFTKAPKGKLPYIEDKGTIVADSTLIRLHLEQKHAIYFDKNLSPRDRGVAWAMEKMLEDHLYWVLVRSRWLVSANFERGPKHFFKAAPALLRPIIIRQVLKRVRANLHGHGLGRHTEEEINAMSARAIEAVSQVLGTNTYLMGDEPCGADATVFAFISGLLTPVFESPQRRMVEGHSNLVAYRDRMMAQFFPNLVAAKAAA
jgi:glutathione S-transferase